MSTTRPPSDPPGDPVSAQSAVAGQAWVEPSAKVHAALADALPVAACMLDRAGLVSWHNRAFAELLQRPSDEIDGEPLLGWIARASEREGFGRAFRGLREREQGTAFAIDASLVARLGPTAACRLRAVKLDDDLVGLSCLPIAAAESSPESELGRAVTRGLDALDQGVLLVEADGRVMHCNPAGSALLGGAVVGRNVMELVEGTATTTLLRALSVARGGSWQGELTLRRPDGEALPAELSIAAGSGARVVLVRDLRERRRREFEARVAAQVDRALVSSPDPRACVAAAAQALAAAVSAHHVAMLVRHGG
ncbi:MAG: PAS domain-containing protein, partial [Nannocystaceae bacterium]